MKTMHSEIKDRRISIFVISKRSDQITAIKWAEYTEINQDRPVWGGGGKYVTSCIDKSVSKKLTGMCLDLPFQLLVRGNLVPQGKYLCQWNLRAAPWEFERWYVLPWPLLQSLPDMFVNHFLEIIEILWTLFHLLLRQTNRRGRGVNFLAESSGKFASPACAELGPASPGTLLFNFEISSSARSHSATNRFSCSSRIAWISLLSWIWDLFFFNADFIFCCFYFLVSSIFLVASASALFLPSTTLEERVLLLVYTCSLMICDGCSKKKQHMMNCGKNADIV